MQTNLRKLIFLALTALSALSHAGPAILFNTSHAGNDAVAAINSVLGATGCGGVSCVDNASTGLYVDGTNCDGSGDVNDGTMVANATNNTNTYFSIQSCIGDNHANYGVLNTSKTGYSLSFTELANFTALKNGDIAWAYAFVAAQSDNTPPGIYTYNMALTGYAPGQGAGVEFTLSNSYKGLNTCCASEVTGNMAGFIATMQYQHPTWTKGDIKGAFRQTASNWSTGYNVTTYGFGVVDFDSATAVSSTSNIYLQGPILQASVTGSNITLTVYPFRQTRRDHERIYAAPASYAWPVKNEYTTGDLSAAGVILVWDDSAQASNAIPSATVSLPSLGTGRWNIIGFTTDGAGGFSRVETFSPVTISGACL